MPSWPRARSTSTVWLPIKPAPPVTNTFISASVAGHGSDVPEYAPAAQIDGPPNTRIGPPSTTGVVVKLGVAGIGVLVVPSVGVDETAMLQMRVAAEAILSVGQDV